MSELDTILGFRRVLRGERYNPFSEPPYRGAYPFAPRGISTTTNFLTLSQAISYNMAGVLRARSPQSTNYLYEDRRKWTPLGQDYPKSKTTAYPRITTERQPFWRGTPVDPDTGEIRKLVPSKVDPSGWTYIPDRPGVLKKASLSLGYGFENPYKVIICLKRKMRKEIMHALGYAGGKNFKPPHYNEWSYVRCL